MATAINLLLYIHYTLVALYDYSPIIYTTMHT